MDLRQLRYFVALAETLHFGRAAERLHLTQPPLSRRIAALESELAVVLFERHSRSVTLTAAGSDLYNRALRLLADADRAKRSARAISAGASGELCVAFSMYAAWNVMPRLVGRFAETYPDVALTLEETLPRDLHETLVDGRADVGIGLPLARSGSTPTGQVYRRLTDESLCAVLPADHRLARQQRIDVADLAEQPFVTFPRSTAPFLYEAVIDCCRQHGFSPKIRLETHLQQTIVTLVAEGLGVSLVPESLARIRLTGVVFRPIEAAPAVEQGLYWRRANTNPCLTTFLACVDDVVGPASV